MDQATAIATEPLTSDDWEIIVSPLLSFPKKFVDQLQEIHASHVESTLLSQVRVAKIGQEIDFWVLGRTRIRLRVGLFVNKISQFGLSNVDPVSVRPSAKDDALLLTTNTEVSISPKLHKQQLPLKSNGHSVSAKNPAENIQSTTKPEPTSKPGNSEVLRVLPSRFLQETSTTHLSSELIAFVSIGTFAKLFGSTSDGGTCFQARFKRMQGPADPTSTQSSETNPNHVAHVFKAGSSAKGKESEGIEDSGHLGSGEIYVGCSHNVIDHHIIFSALTEDIEEWDLVRYTLVSFFVPFLMTLE